MSSTLSTTQTPQRICSDMNIMKRKLFHLVALVAYATFAFYLLLFEVIIIPTLLVVPIAFFLDALYQWVRGPRPKDRIWLLIALLWLFVTLALISFLSLLVLSFGSVRRGSNAMNSLGLFIPS